jgi:hypothetical protein
MSEVPANGDRRDDHRHEEMTVARTETTAG